MPLDNSSTGYGTVARSLHWVIAALIVLQFLLAPIPERLPPGVHVTPLFGLDIAGQLAAHKSFGMTVLMLMIVRFLWRLRSAPPPLPATMKPFTRGLAHASHIGFYVILFAMPLTGWLMISAKGSSVAWFGLWNWPNLVAQNERAFETFRMIHDTLSRVLFFLAILHVVAALKHHFWNKDNVLVRMLPFGRSERRSEL